MRSKLQQYAPVAIIVLVISYAYISNWCIDVVGTCYGTLIHQTALGFTKPLYFFALYSLPLAVVLIFIRPDVFKGWLKIALWGVPLSAIFIASRPVWSEGFMELYSFLRDDAARLAAILFSVASLLFIGWKYYSLRKLGHPVS